MGCQTFKIKRGERCIINLTCTSTGSPIDWSNVRVRVSLRECAEGPVVTQFDTAGGDQGTSCSFSVTGIGEYSGTLIAEGSTTNQWPDTLEGDFWFYRQTPIFGPHISPEKFFIDVRQPDTQTP